MTRARWAAGTALLAMTLAITAVAPAQAAPSAAADVSALDAALDRSAELAKKGVRATVTRSYSHPDFTSEIVSRVAVVPNRAIERITETMTYLTVSPGGQNSFTTQKVRGIDPEAGRWLQASSLAVGQRSYRIVQQAQKAAFGAPVDVVTQYQGMPFYDLVPSYYEWEFRGLGPAVRVGVTEKTPSGPGLRTFAVQRSTDARDIYVVDVNESTGLVAAITYKTVSSDNVKGTTVTTFEQLGAEVGAAIDGIPAGAKTGEHSRLIQVSPGIIARDAGKAAGAAITKAAKAKKQKLTSALLRQQGQVRATASFPYPYEVNYFCPEAAMTATASATGVQLTVSCSAGDEQVAAQVGLSVVGGKIRVGKATVS